MPPAPPFRQHEEILEVETWAGEKRRVAVEPHGKADSLASDSGDDRFRVRGRTEQRFAKAGLRGLDLLGEPLVLGKRLYQTEDERQVSNTRRLYAQIERPSLERRHRHGRPAQRATVGRVVIGRHVLGQRDVRNAGVDKHFHPVVDFRRGEDLPAGLAHELDATGLRLTGVADVIDDQGFLSGHLPLIEARERVPMVGVERKRRK